MFEIRHAAVDEVGDILAVWAEADVEPTITDDEDALRTLLWHAPQAVLVAVDGERVVGTVIVAWDGWRGGFYRLAVAPAWRRRGVARRLVAVGEAQLAELGARRIAVFAVAGDPGPVAFWQSVGYTAQSDRQRLVRNPALNAGDADAAEPVDGQSQRRPGPAMMASGEERQRLGRTFDSAADLYHRARPDYPAELFDALVATAGLHPGDHLLEVGAATGKATMPLARRGFRVVALEPGPNLAAAARRNLAGTGALVVESRFEDWDSDERFDLVFAATSWHWPDPATKYRKAWSLLRPGGHLAFWSAGHVFPDGGDPFFRDIQPLYDQIGEGLPADAPWPRPGEVADEREQIEASGLFEVALIRHFDWERIYDADGYIELLNTFSGHIAMEDWQRERLYGEIRRRLAERADGLLRRHWGAVLHVARRLDAQR